MNDMTLSLPCAGIAVAAAGVRMLRRSLAGAGAEAGIEPTRDRVAVAGGAH